MNNAPTPETDANLVAIGDYSVHKWVKADFARKLERERDAERTLVIYLKRDCDELREQRDEARQEKAHAEIIYCERLNSVARVRETLAGEVVALRAELEAVKCNESYAWANTKEIDMIRIKVESDLLACQRGAAELREAAETLIKGHEVGGYTIGDFFAAVAGLRAALANPTGTNFVRRELLEKCAEALEYWSKVGFTAHSAEKLRTVLAHTLAELNKPATKEKE